MRSSASSQTTVNFQGENHGQFAVGNYIIQIGSILAGFRVDIRFPGSRPKSRLRAMPVQVRPRPFRELLDRQAETKAAAEALQNAIPVEFYGAPGIGKTVLLRSLAHHPITQAFPAGIISLPANQQPLEDLLLDIYRCFYDSEGYKPLPGELRLALQDQQALILLDDLDLPREQVQALMDALPRCTFLLATGQRRLWGEGRAYNLAGLPGEDAQALLERELGRKLNDAELLAVQDLTAKLNGHPLRLLQAVALAQASHRSLVEMAAGLQSEAAPDALDRQVLDRLPEREFRVVTAVAAMGGAPLHREHIAAVTQTEPIQPLLDSLEARGILRSNNLTYTLAGDLIRLFPDNENLSAWRTTLMEQLTGRAQSLPLNSPRRLEDARAMQPLMAWAAGSGRWEAALRLARSAEAPLALTGSWSAWENVLQTALTAAQTLKNEPARAWALHQLGTRHLCLGEQAAARELLVQALRLRERLKDRAGIQVTRHNLNILLAPPASGPRTKPPRSFLPGRNLLLLLIPLLTGLLALTLVVLAGVAVALPGLLATPIPPTQMILLPETGPTNLPVSVPTQAVPLIATSTETPTLTPTPIQTPTSTPTPTPTLRPSFTPTRCGPPAGWVRYTVRGGDTLNKLARSTRTSVDRIRLANCLTGTTIVAGDQLFLPFIPETPTDTPTYTPTATDEPPIVCFPPEGWVSYQVQPGDTLVGIAALFDASVKELIRGNCLKEADLTPGQTIYVPDFEKVEPTTEVPTTEAPPEEVPTTVAPPEEAPITTEVPLVEGTATDPPPVEVAPTQ